nr:DUF411 domain-containing protein [uncultured Rhodopila sp.]
MTSALTTRRNALFLGAACVALPLVARAGTLPPLTVWKDASCGCCGGWVRPMQAAGFSVTVHDTSDMAAIKRQRGVPDALQSCHTAVIDSYVVEGHVPAADVIRLLADRPEARGVSAPGMPASAPGMDQPGEPYTVVLFGTPAGDSVYATH